MNKLRRHALKYLQLPLLCVPFGLAGAAAAAARSGLAQPIRLALVESLSGPFANTGEAVFRNLLWATERVNARGGVRLADGRYMALFHDDGRFFREGGTRGTFTVYQTLSADGGRTWSTPEVVVARPDLDLCEPGAVRSPDGGEIAVLLREVRTLRMMPCSDSSAGLAHNSSNSHRRCTSESLRDITGVLKRQNLPFSVYPAAVSSGSAG